MKKMILCGMLFIIYHTTALAQNGLLDTISVYIEDFKQEAKKDNSALWGVTLDLPLLISTPHFCVTSIPVEGFMPYKNLYYGKVDDLEKGGSTCKNWRGQNWALCSYDTNRKKLLNTFFHEVFHCDQYILNLTGSWTQCKHLNEYEARCLLRLEFTALLKALKSNTVDSVAIIDALTFRAYRYALYPNAYIEESQIEMLEGIANYTGLKLSGETHDEILTQLNTKMNYNPQLFAYWTGAAYCFVLDRVDSLWRKQIRKNDNFLYFVQGSMNVQLPDNLKQHIENVQNNYGWHEIATLEKSIAKETKHNVKRYKTLFFQKPVVYIDTKKCRELTFMSNIIFPLANGKVYDRFSTSGDWGHLHSTNEIFLSDEIRLTAPIKVTDTTVKGIGWEITLNPHWTVKLVSKGRYELVETNE
jgi:hypothetical protein